MSKPKKWVRTFEVHLHFQIQRAVELQFGIYRFLRLSALNRHCNPIRHGSHSCTLCKRCNRIYCIPRREQRVLVTSLNYDYTLDKASTFWFPIIKKFSPYSALNPVWYSAITYNICITCVP